MTDSSGAVERVFLRERGRILATLIRLLGGDFDVAEEALQEAFAAALTSGRRRAPANPRAWLIRTARHKAIDACGSGPARARGRRRRSRRARAGTTSRTAQADETRPCPTTGCG